jgi:two-component system nitrogen regulation sensor histidine kinase NtrY
MAGDAEGSAAATGGRTGEGFRRGRLTYERRVLLWALVAAFPAVPIAAVLLWHIDVPDIARWGSLAILIVLWIAGARALQDRIVRPLRVLANVVAALRENDYSVRARDARPDDGLGLALFEANLLGAHLRAQRLGELEATALLRTVMAEIDVAVFAFDDTGRLRLINRAGERVLGQPEAPLLGREAAALGLATALVGDVPRVEELALPGRHGRWGVRRTTVRQDGRVHTLLVLTDLSQTLREEQLAAWQRLVRVLGHEINNSLAPIQSIAHTLRALVAREPSPPDFAPDVARGLSVIAGRSEALARFMASYARLARLPAPQPAPVDVTALIRRAAALETRLPVGVREGPPVVIHADADQVEQVLINLVRNGADAASEAARPTEDGGVGIEWNVRDGHIEIVISDTGPGLPASPNLFVPFFTTKPNGSGIGLVLSRQIAEAHGGTVVLANRTDGPGCAATIRLPLGAATPDAPMNTALPAVTPAR